MWMAPSLSSECGWPLHSQRIERNLYGLLETLIAAKYTKNRLGLLEDANRRAG